MSQIGYTPGTGAEIRTDTGGTSGALMQIIKLAEGAAGSENFLPATVANGLTVDVTRIQTPVQVSAPNTAPAAVRLSNGAAFVDTIPISGSVSISGTPSVNATIQGTPAVTATITGTPAVTATITGTPSVSAAITGTPPVNIAQVAGHNVNPLNPTSGALVPVGLVDPTTGFLLGYGSQFSNCLPPVRLSSSRQGMNGSLSAALALTASMSGSVVVTGIAQNQTYVEGFVITLSTGGRVTLRSSDSAVILFQGTLPVGCFIFPFTHPMYAAAGGVMPKNLVVDTGAGTVGDIVVWGYQGNS